jgi:hypothetical protein
MKRSTYLVVAAIAACSLSSCGLLEAFQQTAAEPEVADKLVKTFEKVPEALSSGDWTSTEIAGTSAGFALILGSLTKWILGRMKSSKPGTIIGGTT